MPWGEEKGKGRGFGSRLRNEPAKQGDAPLGEGSIGKSPHCADAGVGSCLLSLESSQPLCSSTLPSHVPQLPSPYHSTASFPQHPRQGCFSAWPRCADAEDKQRKRLRDPCGDVPCSVLSAALHQTK